MANEKGGLRRLLPLLLFLFYQVESDTTPAFDFFHLISIEWVATILGVGGA
jgi:hypothetical protein